MRHKQELPLHLWDRLLPQALLTLNLLRGSRINPKLSAWAQVNGLFDYNRTPWKTVRSRILVAPWRRWMVHRPRSRVLSLIQDLDLGLLSRAHRQHTPMVSDQGHHTPRVINWFGVSVSGVLFWKSSLVICKESEWLNVLSLKSQHRSICLVTRIELYPSIWNSPTFLTKFSLKVCLLPLNIL